MQKIIASFAIAAAIVAAPATAQAQRTAVVRYADLDLASARGRAIFDRRIAAATESVCGSYAGASSEEQHGIAACRAEVGRQLAARQPDGARLAAR